MGIGLTHYIPLVAYLASWVMCIVALSGKPFYTLCYLMPLLPYRTLRDYFLVFPLGGNVLTFLVICVVIGGLIHGKSLPKSKLYVIWLVFGVYLYISMWIGAMLGNGPAPLWITDVNFATWKDYMLMPLVFLGAALVIKDRKSIRTVVLITAVALLFIDRSALMNSMSRTWAHFDEDKRDGGPLGFAGANGLAAFLAQFSIFFWGFVQFVKRWKVKILFYGLVAATVFATMYTFSRASYIAVIVGAVLLGILKDRKLIPIAIVFLITWQAIVPAAVTERVQMTHDSNGKLEASAEERVRLWEDAKTAFLSSPVFGTGYATYQLRGHVDGLRDTHNWYVKVLIETGMIGGILVGVLLVQTLITGFQLFRQGHDPLYQGLGLGTFLMTCASLLLNCFGDRWTYIEISGLLWVLMGAVVRAMELNQGEALKQVSPAKEKELVSVNPYMMYR